MTQENKNIPQAPQVTPNDEIDLIALAHTLWNGRRTVIKFTLGGLVLGLVFALLSPKEYTASTIMVPQTSSTSNKLGGLSSLAAMAGVNLGSMSSSESLSPMIYPQIVQSIPFQLDLMNSNFNCPGLDEPVTLYDWYTEYKKPGALGTIKKYTLGLPFLLLKALKGEPEMTINDSMTTNDLLSLTEKQEEVRKAISAQLNLNLNDKEGYVTLSTNFEDPVLAAQVAQKAQNLLQQYITKYKQEKAADQLKFVEARYREKETEFEKAQNELALFRDRNRNVSSNVALTEQERLQSQYNLAYSVYSELAKQVETAQIQVKEDTPILTIIEPVQVPNKKTKPNRPMILIIWIFIGSILGLGLIIFRKLDFVHHLTRGA